MKGWRGRGLQTVSIRQTFIIRIKKKLSLYIGFHVFLFEGNIFKTCLNFMRGLAYKLKILTNVALI